jgi:hypothetical protein
MMYVCLVGYDPMEESELQRSLDLIVSSTEAWLDIFNLCRLL